MHDSISLHKTHSFENLSSKCVLGLARTSVMEDPADPLDCVVVKLPYFITMTAERMQAGIRQ